MRILVTGASGFLGAHLMARLAAGGHDLAVLASPQFRPERLRAVEGRYGVVARASDAGAELVYHLASTPLDPAVSDHEHARVIVGGMLALLDELAACPPRRLVVTGSAAEYGSGSGWREDDPPCPDTVFGVLKRAAGDLALLSAIPTVHLRLFTPFGPGEPPRRLIPSAIAAARDGRPVRLRTDGCEQRDYLYVADVVDALIAAGEQPVAPGTAINIATGRGRTVRDVAARVVELMDAGVAIEPGTAPAVLAECSGNPERAARLLGWRARTSFDDGLRHSIRWMEENENA